MKDWSSYYQVTSELPPSKLLVRALEYVEHRGRALDLGAGGLKDTRYLLGLGFRVTAVDAEPSVSVAVEQLGSDRVTTVTARFEDVVLAERSFDLVSAMFSLPFVEPASFDRVFAMLKDSLVAGGIFCGQFFGVRDQWAQNPAMTFHTRGHIDALLAGMQELLIEEREYDGTTANGSPKHWHVFHVIARKLPVQ